MTTPLDRQLQRDLEPYVDRGIFLSAAKWTEAAAHALWISQEWQNEREFANARFDPANSGAAVQQVLAQHGIDAERLAALPDAERDDRTFELNAQALSQVLTPQFQRDFLKRLKRFRQRLRAEHSHIRHEHTGSNADVAGWSPLPHALSESVVLCRGVQAAGRNRLATSRLTSSTNVTRNSIRCGRPVRFSKRCQR